MKRTRIAQTIWTWSIYSDVIWIVTSCFLRKLQRIVIYLDIVFISLDYLPLSEIKKTMSLKHALWRIWND